MPDGDHEFIQACCERWQFDEETAKSLTMKSRSIYAFTVMDAMNIDRTAVVVFESTNACAANSNNLREAVAGTYRKQLLSDLENLKFIEPSPSVAQKAGF